MASWQLASRFARAVALTAFLASVGLAHALPADASDRSTATTTVGVLRSVTRNTVIIESTAENAARTYRIDVFTTVCYEPNLCLESGNTSPLRPGATVSAQVAPDKHGNAHASTIFLTSVAATIRVDSCNGDVITGHSTLHGEPYTIVRRPFTILVDQRGEVRGGVPNLPVGSVISFTGLAGVDKGSRVTIAVRIFA
jgi:hypothetical protein